MVIVPLLVMSPPNPGLARIPTAPFAPVMAMTPSFLAVLLLLIVIAAPLVGFIEPVVVTWMSPEVLVESGVVVAVLITVSAAAGVASRAKTAPRPVDARRRRIETFPCCRRSVHRPLAYALALQRGGQPA